jgi:hypothetical protein
LQRWLLGRTVSITFGISFNPRLEFVAEVLPSGAAQVSDDVARNREAMTLHGEVDMRSRALLAARRIVDENMLKATCDSAIPNREGLPLTSCPSRSHRMLPAVH